MENKFLFTLGHLFVSDFLKPGEEPRYPPVEMKLMLDENGIAELEKVAPSDVMWGDRYWYSSSVSNTMKQQLQDVVKSTLEVYKSELSDKIWVDIAGNTGYMLSQVPTSFFRLNIDPVCKNSEYRTEALKNCDVVISEYFSKHAFHTVFPLNTKASIVSCISMFYDLCDPSQFLDDIHTILADNGLCVFQMSYTPLMLEQLEFGNLCHEHCRYYSFFNLKALLEKHGFQVMDVSLNNTNAGSFRVYAMKSTADITKFGSQTHRDVCNFRMKSLLSYEETLALDDPKTWFKFFDQINKLKEQTLDFIKTAKAEGKIIMGYGASTKFNTTLQYFGLNDEFITAIAERSPAKYGTRTIGTNIPVISEQEMREKQPDFLVIGPFQFLSEFMEREAEYLNKGGKFVCLMPKFEIISK